MRSAILLLALICVVAAFDENLVRCKVCERAVQHVWTKGKELRRHCKTNPQEDKRCDFSNLHPHAVDQMVWGVCDALPTTYQAVHADGAFELILHDDPSHPEQLVALLRETCIKFLHDEHGVENIGRVVLGNLEVNKPTEIILDGLKERFCNAACGQRHDEF